MRGGRILYLDVVRLMACCMVVLMHSPMPATQENSLFLLALSYMTAPCIGLFLMVSGALLLPVREDARVFLRRRLGKVLIPALVWTLFYIVVKSLSDDSVDISAIACRVLSVPFSPQGSGVMWFMYTLIGLYIISPVISPWLEDVKKPTLQLYLSFWFLTLCFPLVEIVLDVNTGITGLYYYLSGYIGYFVLGYYLRRYGDIISLQWCAALCVLSISAPVVCWWLGLEVDFYRVFWYLSVFVAIMAVFWFVLLCNRFSTHKSSGLVARTSNLAFGVYLVYIFIMRDWVWTWGWIRDMDNYVLQVLAIFICTMVISMALCFVISLLPVGDYLIGYKVDKKS